MKGESLRERLSNDREANTTGEENKEVEDVNYKELFLSEEYEAFFVEFAGDIKGRLKNIDYAKMYFTGKFFGIIFVKTGMVNTLVQNVPEIINVQKNFPYTLTGLTVEEGIFSSKGIEKGSVPYNGDGVVVGIISTGIDYLNPRFMKEDGTTRIISIWDQSINNGKSYPNTTFGTEFTSVEINEAIKLSVLGQNPYDKVGHRDEKGYGTAIAGIIGGRKLSETESFASVAPNCNFAIVKLKEAKRNVLAINGIEEPAEEVYGGTDIAEAMNYLSDLQQGLNRPMVVYISLGSNLGAHDGGTVLERYIDFLTERRGFATVASVGSQGLGETHTSGNLLQTGGQDIIVINVDEGERNIIISLFTIQPDKVSIGIIAPDGSTIERIQIPEKSGESVSLTLGSSTISIQNYSDDRIIPDIRLDILIRGIIPGIWQITLKGV